MAKLICLDDYEEVAKEVLPQNVLGYTLGGSDEEITLRDNREGFRRIRLRPRVLRDVSKINMSTTILGDKIDFPIGVAPVGYQRFLWPEGEVAVAQATEAMKTMYAMSSLSTSTMQEVQDSTPSGLRWFQLYSLKNREATLKIVQDAERHGFKALVLTVDMPVPGIRRALLTRPLKLGPGMKTGVFDPKLVSKGVIGSFIADNLDWSFVDWLRTVTKMPILIKGILAPEDAVLAIQHGAAGVIVSNHGGRQLDTAPATIDALPDIVKAVDGRVEVYLDGGIRTGTDVLKALALGARAVFIGRPMLWGLACNGFDGVKRVLEIIKNEFSTAMALTGCRSIEEITPELIWKPRSGSQL